MFQKVFKDQEGLEKAVATEEHNIKNKKVAVKKAQAKQGKVYVGKLPKDDKLSDDAIKEFFATYGTIAAVEQPFDKVTFSNDVLLIQIPHDIMHDISYITRWFYVHYNYR